MLELAELSLLIRVLTSLFAPDAENSFLMFITFVSELFVAPVRYLMDRFELLQNSIVDFSLPATALLLGFLDLMIGLSL